MNVVALLSAWAVPFLIAFIPLYAFLRGVPVYETFIEGAREGFDVVVRILPYMVSIFVALSLFRVSGALDLLGQLLEPVLGRLGLPVEVVPLVLIRPLSGGGALGVTAELLRRYGPDSYIGRLASVIQGSTDTTFYVLTLYFGSVGIKNPRHSVLAGLTGDLAGVIGSLIAMRIFFG